MEEKPIYPPTKLGDTDEDIRERHVLRKVIKSEEEESDRKYDPDMHLTVVGKKSIDKLAVTDSPLVEKQRTGEDLTRYEILDWKFQSLMMQTQLFTQQVEVPLPTDWKAKGLGEKAEIEVSYANTTDFDPHKEDEIDKDVPIMVGITGWFGLAPETNSEQTIAHKVNGTKGVEYYGISWSSEGSPLPGGWGNEVGGMTDFDRQSEIYAQFLQKVRDENPDRKIIIMSQSGGTVIGMKLAASHNDLVDGLVVMEPLSKGENWANLGARFFSYEGKKQGVEPEDHIDTKYYKEETKTPTGGFLARAVRTLKKVIPFNNERQVITIQNAIRTGMSLGRKDLYQDGTVQSLSQTEVPILIVSGSDDHVVKSKDVLELKNSLIKGRIVSAEDGTESVKHVTIDKAGHALPLERPTDVAKQIRTWIQDQKLVPDNYFNGDPSVV